MADSDAQDRGGSDKEQRERSSPLVGSSPQSLSSPQGGTSPSRATVPPSEPRPVSRTSFSMLDAQVDRPARVQMIVVLLLALLLVAIPLYLWRRPRAESIVVVTTPSAVAPPPVVAGGPVGTDDRLQVGEPKIVACQDPGAKKTTVEQCDHLPEIEKALVKAVEENASCVAKAEGGGTIVFVADVSFKRKTIGVSTPKDLRTLKNPKVAQGCERVVKHRLGTLGLESIAHQHSRYKVSVTATYPGAVKP